MRGGGSSWWRQGEHRCGLEHRLEPASLHLCSEVVHIHAQPFARLKRLRSFHVLKSDDFGVVMPLRAIHRAM